MFSPLAVVVTDLETGVIVEVNPGFIAKYGYEKKSIIGHSTVEIGLIEVKNRAVFKNLIVNGGDIVREYFDFFKHDGTLVPVEITAAILEIDGRLRILSFSVDDTRILAAEKRLQLIADASFDAIVLHNEHTILKVNQVMCEISGRSREQLVGLSLWRLLPKEDVTTKTKLGKLTNEMKSASYHINIVRPDGSQRTLNVRSRRVIEAGESCRIVVAQDITGELELKNQLQRAQQMEQLGQLTGGIAHDFNNILAIILGFNNLIIRQLQSAEDGELLRWARQINKSGYRGRNLIKQMLTYSRGGNVRPVPTDPVEIAREALDMIKATVPPSINLNLYLDSVVGKVLIDPGQLNQVLLNLCINASHALTDQENREAVGTINIKIDEKEIDRCFCSACNNEVMGFFVSITVEDNGSGMARETLDKIFQPFFTTKESGLGSGMGLAMLHGIIHDSRGHILVTSEIGKGSSFTVLLPQLAGQPTELKPLSDERQFRTIVVVDDDEIIADMVYRPLLKKGYQALCYQSSQDAWDEFTRNGKQWDLLITDHHMPAINGLQLARNIRAQDHHLPIIIHTGNSNEVSRDVAQKQGFVFLEKPVEQSKLLGSIFELIRSSSDPDNSTQSTISNPG